MQNKTSSLLDYWKHMDEGIPESLCDWSLRNEMARAPSWLMWRRWCLRRLMGGQLLMGGRGGYMSLQLGVSRSFFVEKCTVSEKNTGNGLDFGDMWQPELAVAAVLVVVAVAPIETIGVQSLMFMFPFAGVVLLGLLILSSFLLRARAQSLAGYLGLVKMMMMMM